jgi:hypothetical protein
VKRAANRGDPHRLQSGVRLPALWRYGQLDMRFPHVKVIALWLLPPIATPALLLIVASLLGLAGGWTV